MRAACYFLAAAAVAAAAPCAPPTAGSLLQTLVCSTAANPLAWTQVHWDPNTGGSLQLSGTALCMQAGPTVAAGWALQLARRKP